ncbi:hypothetical protein NE237_002081 [Protea cynaroides]|uniref:Uncharacterized protein n=1 Tax=Protea cynaroides TaxID=273540 RepID=A0A9Q0QYP9_9MAGN|nr:hypothetical protein NE237_002081 [Protea cynaroides]
MECIVTRDWVSLKETQSMVSVASTNGCDDPVVGLVGADQDIVTINEVPYMVSMAMLRPLAESAVSQSVTAWMLKTTWVSCSGDSSRKAAGVPGWFATKHNVISHVGGFVGALVLNKRGGLQIGGLVHVCWTGSNGGTDARSSVVASSTNENGSTVETTMGLTITKAAPMMRCVQSVGGFLSGGELENLGDSNLNHRPAVAIPILHVTVRKVLTSLSHVRDEGGAEFVVVWILSGSGASADAIGSLVDRRIQQWVVFDLVGGIGQVKVGKMPAGRDGSETSGTRGECAGWRRSIPYIT